VSFFSRSVGAGVGTGVVSSDELVFSPGETGYRDFFKVFFLFKTGFFFFFFSFFFFFFLSFFVFAFSVFTLIDGLFYGVVF